MAREGQPTAGSAAAPAASARRGLARTGRESEAPTHRGRLAEYRCDGLPVPHLVLCYAGQSPSASPTCSGSYWCDGLPVPHLRSSKFLTTHRCLFSLQSLYDTKSLHTNSLKVQNAPNTNSRCCFQIIQKNVGQDHVFNLVLLYFSFCIILLWLALRSLSSLAPVIAAGHLPPRSLPGSSVLGR
jgi:hypothetical protein